MEIRTVAIDQEAPEIEFPCDYPIKVMGQASETFRAEVLAVVLRFFSWKEISFLFTGTGLLVILNLVLSEGLLSFDNAIVLAVLVSHLPKDKSYRLGPVKMSIPGSFQPAL